MRAGWEPDGGIAVDTVNEAVQVVQTVAIDTQTAPWNGMRQQERVASAWRRGSGNRCRQRERLADTIARGRDACDQDYNGEEC